jgi:hypothetical protein
MPMDPIDRIAFIGFGEVDGIRGAARTSRGEHGRCICIEIRLALSIWVSPISASTAS